VLALTFNGALVRKRSIGVSACKYDDEIVQIGPAKDFFLLESLGVKRKKQFRSAVLYDVGNCASCNFCIHTERWGGGDKPGGPGCKEQFGNSGVQFSIHRISRCQAGIAPAALMAPPVRCR